MKAWPVLPLFLGFFLGSCPPKPTPSPGAPDAGPLAACEKPSIVSSASICDGMFTPDGRACARCLGNEGCLDYDLQIYCVAGGCAFDSACRLEPESGLQRRRR